MSDGCESSGKAHRSYSGVGAALLVVACAAACTIPVLGGLIAGTFVDRLLDVPAWVVVLVALVVSATTFAVIRRRRATRGC